VLIQPTDRGTAAGILFPIHWVARQDPDASPEVEYGWIELGTDMYESSLKSRARANERACISI